MTAVIFLSAFVGGYVKASKNGASRLGSFGISIFLALAITALAKYVFGL